MTIRSELEALKNEDGLVVVETAVEWARRNPTSALHEALPWNDAEAAHQHRLFLVRRLISIHVVSEKGVREMVSLTIDRHRPGGGYRDLEDVMRAPNLRGILLKDALAELDRVQKKYSTLSELSKVWSEVKRVRRKATAEQPGANVA